MLTKDFMKELAEELAHLIVAELKRIESIQPPVKSKESQVWPQVMDLKTGAVHQPWLSHPLAHGRDRTYMYDMVRTNKIPSRRYGARIFLSREDLNKWAKSSLD